MRDQQKRTVLERLPGPWRVHHTPWGMHYVGAGPLIGGYGDQRSRDCVVANVTDRSVAEAVAAVPQLVEVLKAYEKWEADVILCDEAWGGMEPLPTIPQHLWDRLVEIQGMRNAALAKARGEESHA